MIPRIKIGTNDYMPVCVDEEDRFKHIILMGKSGTGKSSSISNWWQQDSYYPFAKVLIEPSGFLARDCFSLSGGKALYCSVDSPLSLNPMQAPYDPNQISDIISEALNQVIVQTTPNDKLTVKMRGILDEAIKWCLERNRKNLLSVRDYIANLKGNTETRDGIIQRLGFLLTDERMIPILCGNDSVEWGELISQRKTFILDAFQMGSEKMIFAGNLISQGIKNYFRFQRPKEYHPLALYVDECHNFVNLNFLDILKEGRKYKLAVILSTQDFSSIDEKLARVMMNVGTIISYRVGYREASLIAREMDMPAQSLQFLEKYHVAYMTPKEKGIAKAPRPPIFKKLEVKIEEPKRKSKGWFTLEPYKTV